jgi:hypothetical protein
VTDVVTSAVEGRCKLCPAVLWGSYYFGFCQSCLRSIRFPQHDMARQRLLEPVQREARP